MTAFSAIDIGRTGVGFSSKWVDTIAHNIANVSTEVPGDEEPFRERMLVARALTDEIVPSGSGVATEAVVERDEEPITLYQPDHPLADEDGYINKPNVDLAGQLADLMVAQRSYQANAQSVTSAKEAYEAALQIGQV